MPKKDIRPGRMIHIRVSEKLHKQMRMRAAELDTTMQGWVASTITKALQRRQTASKRPE